MSLDFSVKKLNENANLMPEELSGDENEEGGGQQAKKTNLLAGTATIMKTMMGVGIISLPFTMSRLGYLLSIIIFIVGMLMSQFSSILLLKSKNLSGHSNYSTIAYHIFSSQAFQVLCSMIVLINNLGICIIDLTIFKGSLKLIIDTYITDEQIKNAFYVSQIMIVIVVAILQVPLAIQKKIQKLRFGAYLGISGVVIFVIGLTITFFTKMHQKEWQCSPEVVAFQSDKLGIISVLPNFMFAFGYHINLFPVFKALKVSGDSRAAKASILAVLGCAIIYFYVGNMGYCLYGRSVKGNFLLNFTKQEIGQPLFLLLNCGFLCCVFFSFPFIFFGARNNFIAIIKIIKSEIKKKNTKKESLLDETEEQIAQRSQIGEVNERKQQVLFYLGTIGLFLLAIIITITVNSIQSVFNIVGSIASNSLTYILPTLFYHTLIRKKGQPKTIVYFVALVEFILCFPFAAIAIASNFI